MQTFLKGKRVGYWLSEKKIKKLNFQAFAELCRKRGIEVVQLNLSRPIEEQGPLDVIIHKLTDVILEADQNDSQSLELVHRFQEYIDAHPETIVLDPLPAIRTLLDRSKSYELIRKIEAYMKDDRICSPPFMELTSLCGDDTMRLLEENGLAFPFICKTRVAHGTNSHEMAIVFNQEGLSAIQPPCVVQNFINHNAVLYKVFVVGESYTVVQRPSLKNFSAGTSAGQDRGRVRAAERRGHPGAVPGPAAGAGRVAIWDRHHHQQPDGAARSHRHQRFPRLRGRERVLHRPPEPHRHRPAGPERSHGGGGGRGPAEAQQAPGGAGGQPGGRADVQRQPGLLQQHDGPGAALGGRGRRGRRGRHRQAAAPETRLHRRRVAQLPAALRGLAGHQGLLPVAAEPGTQRGGAAAEHTCWASGSQR
uniref:Inositol-tetrakisphosphate 1-kinase n=1 Tax=Equus caballus TaxID=9796 RepID=A0A9L0TF17_HORSE